MFGMSGISPVVRRLWPNLPYWAGGPSIGWLAAFQYMSPPTWMNGVGRGSGPNGAPLRSASSSLLKNPRHSECIVIQFFYHESAGAGMRGAFMDQGGLFSYIAPEARVP